MSSKRSVAHEVAIGLVVAVVGGLLVAVLLALLRIGQPQVSEAGHGGSAPVTDAVQGEPEPTPAEEEQRPSPTGEAPSATYLTTLVPLESEDPVESIATLGGTTYVRAVALSSGGCGRNQETGFTWVINGEYSSLATTVGLDDRSLSETQVQVEILLDGSPAFSQTVQAGTLVPVTLDVSGVREIELHQTYIGPRPNICSEDATAVWADPLLTR